MGDEGQETVSRPCRALVCAFLVMLDSVSLTSVLLAPALVIYVHLYSQLNLTMYKPQICCSPSLFFVYCSSPHRLRLV